MKDDQLHQDVLDELDFEPSINAAHIGVAVDDGIVTLTGEVGSFAEKYNAERAVRRVKGVHGIVEHIKVVFPSDKVTGDAEIAERVLASLKWSALVPADRVTVKVENGWVALNGELDWQFQKSAAEAAVRRLSGIKGISNLIKLPPQVAGTNVKQRIEDALKRNAEVEAQRIQVGVNGSKVILNGSVDTWHERNVAESAAWAVPGVTMVEDHLRIA
ncbi:BON domain-containing protein [Asticcacaulis taihuensis]|uniref:Osmotically-inducible protein OsmY, contains BON domain n=1 Tax=Asticcacaulis taihuensis TaxID=260084 RepID=A0A1G4T2Y8_9CAUL|nr:BON domain-containing protein [Asticcacaulis taihuensis]SCW75661.1 Osmotically-inducible protein OsmY, contains BON domain [Asticcacaulis taihuensis]